MPSTGDVIFYLTCLVYTPYCILENFNTLEIMNLALNCNARKLTVNCN